jgi:hypothetical protein
VCLDSLGCARVCLGVCPSCVVSLLFGSGHVLFSSPINIKIRNSPAYSRKNREITSWLGERICKRVNILSCIHGPEIALSEDLYLKGKI